MTQHRTPETLVKETLGVEPSPADRRAVWHSIAERLGDDEARGRTPARERFRRLRRLPDLAAVGVAALAATLAAVALLPAGDEPRDSGAPTLATASAAEVLDATARSAGSSLRSVGPGEYLFVRSRLTVPGVGASRVDTSSWTAIDGSARIVAHERRCVERERTDGGAERCARYATEVTTMTYRAGSDAGVVTEDGVERPPAVPQVSLNWRHVVSGEEVVRLPADRDALLASLRARAEGAARVYERPRPKGYHPRVDRTYELWGRDLLVVQTATDLLLEAPLSPAQRTAMLSMLADAPGWYEPGTSAEPIEIHNLGSTEDALGREGIALRFTLELTPGETRRASPGTFDLVLDPQAGRLLETRSYEHGAGAEPVTLTVVAQRVAESIDG